MTAADRPVRPDPTDTDREAVARVPRYPMGLTVGGPAADAILTTRDPAARAALIRSVIAGGTEDVLDALVEVGALRRRLGGGPGWGETWFQPKPPTSDEAIAILRERFTSRQDGQDGPVSAADATEAPTEVQGRERAAERREIAQELAEMAVQRFTDYGPTDPRGAALWDASCHLDTPPRQEHP